MSSILTLAGNNTSSGFYPHSIDQSLRFEDGDSTVLHRTPSSASNRKTWSFSCWIKLGNLQITAVNQSIFSAGSNVYNRRVDISIGSGNRLMFFMDGRLDGASYYSFIADRLLRDTSAWMHIMAVMDTTNSTADDRLKLYVNGEQQSGAYQYGHGAPPLNSDWYINSTYEHDIADGHHDTVSQYWDGYIAEVNFIDGTALTADSFGEFKDSIWVPKDVSGLTHGTNGFHLDFADSSAIGNDVSGSDNDWTPSGLAATDVVLDSPTNNFAVLNAVNKHTGATLSEGNLKVTHDSGAGDCPATMALPSEGKWYWEVKCTNNANMAAGIKPTSDTISQNSISTGYHYYGNGQFYTNVSGVAYGATFTSNDVIGVAYNADANEINFYKNNAAQGVKSVAVGEYYPNAASGSASVIEANFGQSSFAYTPPSGFLALCTANLPEPSIIDGSEYFNAVLYTGDGSNGQAITGVGHQPDFLWIKSRTGTAYHELHDSVRGAGKRLFSNETTAESNVGTVSSFDSDGFTVSRNSAYDGTNQNGVSFVAWNWKAGGSAVSNSDGTITSSVSANPEAGFSIVSFTHDGTNASTIGHGLGKTPTAIIMKQRSAVSDWRVFHSGLADGKNILLNSTNAVTQAGDIFQTAPTSTVFTSGNGDSGNGKTYIAYCFTDIESYSKAGVYTGTGSTAFIHCGFRPAWVMIRRTNIAAGWGIIDNKRNPHNSLNRYVNANSANAEGVGTAGTKYVDFVSNGFRCISSDAGFNASGDNYIFIAFAEQPFKYSNAR